MILFRVDSGSLIGSGHIGRCRRLAEAFQVLGHKIVFASRPNPGHCLDLLRDSGIEVVELPLATDGNGMSADPSTWLPGGACADAENLLVEIDRRRWNVKLLVVDHYAISASWEEYFYNSIPILAFDDLGVEEHKVSLLLHQNIDTEITQHIRERNSSVPLWSGVSNILFSSNLLSLSKERSLIARYPPRNVIVFFGGCDPDRACLRVAALLKSARLDFSSVLIIAGVMEGRVKDIEGFVKDDPRFEVVALSENFYGRLANCDLFIGAGGSSSYERGLLGIPSVTLSIAENQIPFARKLGDLGATVYMGRSNEVSDVEILKLLHSIWQNESLCRRMNQVSKETFAGANGARDVAERICDHFQLGISSIPNQ